MDDDARRAARSSATFGRDSLRKRSPEIQAALNLLTASSKRDMPNGETTVDFRADLRDLNLQGAALGPGYLRTRSSTAPTSTTWTVASARAREAPTSAGPTSGAPASTAPSSSAILKKVNLQGAHFDAPVDEHGTPRPEQPTVLTNADLSNADLREASFAEATLQGAG
jgi:uncharacterized protein YjbI with pentapeptide repeats